MAGKAILFFHFFFIPVIIFYIFDRLLSKRFDMEDRDKPINKRMAIYVFCLFLVGSYVGFWLFWLWTFDYMFTFSESIKLFFLLVPYKHYFQVLVPIVMAMIYTGGLAYSMRKKTDSKDPSSGENK